MPRYIEELNENTTPATGDWLWIVDVSAGATDQDRKLSVGKLALLATTTGQQLTVLAASASTVGLVVDTAASPTAAALQIKVNGTDAFGIGPTGWLAVAYTNSYSTSAWVSGGWYDVIPAGALVANGLYVVKMVWDHGVGGPPYSINGSCNLSPVVTNGTGTGDTIVTGNWATHQGGGSYYALRALCAGSSVSGLSVSPNFTAAYGTFTVTVYRLA